MFLEYLPIVAAAFSVIVTVICVLLGIKRGVLNSGMRLAFFLLAGVISFFVAKYVAGIIAAELYQMILPMLQLEIQLPSLEALTQKAVSGLLSPLCFIILFFVIDKLTFIIYKPLKSFFSKKRTSGYSLLNRTLGGVLGAVLALAIIAVCLMPVNGYVSFAGETLDDICSTSIGAEIPDEITGTVAQINDLPGMQLTRDLSGWLFRALSTDAVSARDSAMIVIKAADSLMGSFGGDNEGSSPEPQLPAADVFENLTVESAELVSGLLSDAVQTMIPDAKPVADLVSTMTETVLVGLATSKETLSEEAYQEEVQAVQTIISQITENENASLKELLKTVLTSSTLTNAVASIAEDIPAELVDSLQVDASTQQELAAMMSDANASGKLSADDLNAIAALLGMPEIY